MKKLILSFAVVAIGAAAYFGVNSISSSSNSSLLAQNIEALAAGEGGSGTVVGVVCKYLGCCGGSNKCFSGSISIKGVSISGTFYMK